MKKNTKNSTKKINWKLERRKLSELIPHPQNPRHFTEKGMKDLENSINSIGFAQPININQVGTILSGHARVLKLQEMGETEVDVYVPDCALTPKQEEEILIRMNANTAGQWDYDKLANEFELPELQDWGLELPDIEALEPEETVGDDEVPEVPTKSITIRNDIYELGKHKLLCGDSTMINDVEKLMTGEKADMVFTDPPYGVGIKGKFTGKILNDNLKDNDLCDFLFLCFTNLKLFSNGNLYISYEIKNHSIFEDALKKSGFIFDEIIIWNKDSASFYSNNKYNRKFEPIFFIENGKPLSCKPDVNVWDFAKSSSFASRDENNKRFNEVGNFLVAHPTTKPVLLVSKAIENSSKQGDAVVDLFLGSGSTLIACEKTNRKCYGMELDEKYCDVVVKRYIQFCEANNIKPSVKRNGEDCLQQFKQ